VLPEIVQVISVGVSGDFIFNRMKCPGKTFAALPEIGVSPESSQTMASCGGEPDACNTGRSLARVGDSNKGGEVGAGVGVGSDINLVSCLAISLRLGGRLDMVLDLRAIRRAKTTRPFLLARSTYRLPNLVAWILFVKIFCDYEMLMRLRDAFEKIYAIGLPTSRSRQRRLSTHFEEVGIARVTDITWVQGTDGSLTPPPSWFGGGPGAWGCLMSHVRVVEQAVHDKIATFCILEDDVVFHPRSPGMLSEFMKQLPEDWEQIYLGGQHLYKEPSAVSPWVVKPYNVNRTHAYALKGSVAPEFLQHVLNAPDYFSIERNSEGDSILMQNGSHIDHQLGRAHEVSRWRTYAPAWWIAGQEEGLSTISGQLNRRLWWNWSENGWHLPFFAVASGAAKIDLLAIEAHLHIKGGLEDLSDAGLESLDDLSDDALLRWLGTVAVEAVELWKLPALKCDDMSIASSLVDRIGRIWPAGILEADPAIVSSAADYPFNGICGFDGVSGATQFN
jgi:hypothetical protein